MTYRDTFALVLLAFAACGDPAQPATPMPDAGADAGPPVIPLERAHAGGSPEVITIAGNRAYVGVGPRLAIWELGGPSGPTLAGETEPLRGVIEALAVVGTRAYVAERLDLDSRLHVFDISNPAAPVQTAERSLAGPTAASVIRDLEPAPGDILYAADQEQGVLVIDIASPDAPSVVAIAGSGGVTGVQLVGSRLYGLQAGFGASGYRVLDAANELEDLGGGRTFGVSVAFAGRWMIAAGPDGIFVHDVSDPSNPEELFAYGAPDEGPFSRAIAVHGRLAYIPAHDGLHVLDLSNPTTIAHTGPLEALTANAEAAVAADGVLAITTDRGRMLTYSIAIPDQPDDANVVDVSLCADCVAADVVIGGDVGVADIVGASVVDATLYVADIVGGLRTAHLADLSQLARSPELPVVPNAGGRQLVFEDVRVARGVAYVADWMHGLRVYDVANPASLVYLGSLVTGGSPSALAIDADRMYLTESTNGGNLHAFDISSPVQPIQLGRVETSQSLDVEARDGLAYVADESLRATGGLRIFDVGDPATIDLVGHYDEDCSNARDVALVGDLAIIACGSDGFHVVDVSTPSTPTRVAIIDAMGATSAWSVAGWDGYAVLGHDTGIVVVSLADPRAPQTVVALPTARPPRAIAVPTPGRIVAACGLAGVYQWQLE